MMMIVVWMFLFKISPKEIKFLNITFIRSAIKIKVGIS